MKPIFEATMTPKDPDASIERIIIRINDPKNIDTHDKCVDFLEKQFPMYHMETVLKGYRQ